MIGYAVEERCPYCRAVLGTTAVEPGVTVLRSPKCRSRVCRGRTFWLTIRDGRATYLTSEQAASMMSAQDGAAAATRSA